ncbi:type I polyketide synthase [Allokutzneria albata]|uniref:Acyl transferase domain-containing protein n=1 Tax=Allokutzneria albata TaxID=211114 RepID=A0A1H0BYE4_ALLAB|nr:type I polyketide synthase [Allokutzneria albata]SDN50510.1 Acyl transferase domain-containing protein [Allokutzneria albata]
MSEDEKLLAYLKKVAGDLATAREQLKAKETAENEPIAIVSMGCRFAGGVRSPEDLWDLVVEGRDAVGGFPTDRGWDPALLDAGDSDVKGSTTQQGAFIYDAGDFDPAFFGISPREALAMDPQQRLVLEVAWEAIERARIDPLSLRGTKAGMFVGATSFNYGGDYLGAPEELGGHLITGNVTSVLSGRVNYTLGLEGPSMTFDTACSSSLVAMHLAAQALRRGECSLALAGGAAIMSTAGVFVEFSRQRGLAADGRCKSFAEAADGTGWGEGVGLVLLEKLSDARRNGHPVLAVLRGSAWNQDGASNGLTAPNGRAQQRVIKQALANAGLKSEDIDVVEAHGTGTTLGDPIEANALINTYGKERPADRPLWLGSLKSNIAHTQAAAGSGSVIKMVMALQHGLLPKTLHVDAPSSEINWSAGAVSLLTEAVPWRAGDRVRRAGVSAFGVSGTNAHLILEEAPPVEEAPRVIESPPVMPWVLSGRGADALKAQASRLASFVDSQEPVDLAYSLATTRSAFENRAVVLAGSNSEFTAALDLTGENVIVGEAIGDPRPVFVFPGQGSQWAGMAVELIDSSPVFAKRIKECDEALSEFVDFSVVDVLRGKPGTPSTERVDVIQPLLWAVMVSLAELWRSFGVEPAAVIGHSQGEIAAAAVSGALSLSDAARVCALRSRSIVALSDRGGMLSLTMPLADASKLIEKWGAKVSVAAVNGPSSVVVSGEPQALVEVQQAAEAQEVRARMIDVNYASHSAQVEELRAELLEVLAPIKPRSSEISFISTVTGEPIDTAKLDAEYWVTNLRQTVQLEAATRAALERRHRLFIEASPHPVLGIALQSTAESADAQAVVVGSLRRNEGGVERFLRSAAEAYVNGAPVTWEAAFAELPARKIALPTYAFQRQQYWYTPPTPSTASPAETRFWDAVDSEDLTSVAATLGLGSDAPLSEVVSSLSSWRRRSIEVSAVDDWCYEIGWRSVTLSEKALSGNWLVVTPASGAESVKDVLSLMSAAGAEITRIDVDATDVAERADLAGRIGGVCGDDARPCKQVFDGVLSLLALDDSARTAGLVGTLTLTQALGDAGIDAPLWCVTQSAIALNAAEPLANPDQAMVWGLAGSYGAERPQRWGGLVDLPEQADERSLSQLVAALGSSEPGEQYAVRQSGVFVRRLAPAVARRARRDWKPSGTVVITGGLGALGSHLARWVTANGAEHVLLLGRRGLETPGAPELCDELGATVVACDVADREQLAAALAQAPTPIKAVFHAAGVLDDSPLDSLTTEQLEKVIRSKAEAARNLHELTSDLDAFVMFSAVAGTIGVAGQGNYAAANAYLDALAQHRRSQGLPATTVAWSAWADSGMVDAATAEVLKSRGIPAMSRELATTALQRALDVDETFLVVADITWEKFLDSGAVTATPLLAEVIPASSEEPEDTGELRAKLSTVDKVAGLRLLQDVVIAQAGSVLGYDGATLPAQRSFKELGVDSLTAVQLRNRLSEATGLRLPVTLAFDHPNAAALAEHLYEELAPSVSGVADLVREELDKLEATLTSVPADDAAAREAITARLRALMWKWEGADTASTDTDNLDAATDDEVFDLLDKELGFA